MVAHTQIQNRRKTLQVKVKILGGLLVFLDRLRVGLVVRLYPSFNKSLTRTFRALAIIRVETVLEVDSLKVGVNADHVFFYITADLRLLARHLPFSFWKTYHRNLSSYYNFLPQRRCFCFCFALQACVVAQICRASRNFYNLRFFSLARQTAGPSHWFSILRNSLPACEKFRLKSRVLL